MAGHGLSDMSITELQSEIRKRQRNLRSLERKRDRLVEQLREVEEQIREAGGLVAAAGGAGGRVRPRNDQNLADSLADLLSDQTLSVTAAAEEVQRAGYKTTSPNFRTIVNQTLLKDNRFKRVGRGLYTSSPNAAAASSTKTKKKRTRKARS